VKKPVYAMELDDHRSELSLAHATERIPSSHCAILGIYRVSTTD